jgi:hypothetical protein
LPISFSYHFRCPGVAESTCCSSAMRNFSSTASIAEMTRLVGRRLSSTSRAASWTVLRRVSAKRPRNAVISHRMTKLPIKRVESLRFRNQTISGVTRWRFTAGRSACYGLTDKTFTSATGASGLTYPMALGLAFT